MQKEISCRISNAVLKYVSHQGLDTSVLLEGFGLDSEYLTNAHNWISLEKIQALYRRAQRLFDSPEVIYEVGFHADKLDALGALSTIFKLTGNPRRLFEQMPKLIRYLDRISDVEILRISDTGALVEVRYHSGFQRIRANCDFTSGLFASLPTLWGNKPASVEQVECAAHLNQFESIGNFRYVVRENGKVMRLAIHDSENETEYGMLTKEGTIEIDGIVYGALGCVYKVTWTDEAREGAPWWNRTFGSWDRRQTIVDQLTKDLRVIERQYDDLYKISSQLELMVEERTLQLYNKQTELKALNEKLERANKQKSDYLANMSHELRTPITAIIGFTDLLLQGIHGELTIKQKKSLRRIAANTHNLLYTINEVLDLSKLQAGKMNVFWEELNIREVVDETVNTISALLEQKGLEAVLLVSEDVPAFFKSDKTKLKQILLNLLSNAIKFTESGCVTLSVKLQEGITFGVSDTGCGIESSQFSVLFDEFTPVSKDLVTGQKGTGLGLSITKQLVELMGGKIYVESEQGVGSTFSVALPLTGSLKQIEDEGLRVLEKGGAGRTILVVDPNPEMTKSLKLSIEAAGYSVLTLTRGKEIINVAKEQKVSAIILEPMLVHKDGWAALQELKRDQDTRRIPVVIFSVVDEPALAISLGAEASFVKPVDRPLVIKKVLELASAHESKKIE